MRTKIVQEVYREYGDWAARDPSFNFNMSRAYACTDEVNSYFKIPVSAHHGWITLCYGPKRPGPDWLKLKLTYAPGMFSLHATRTLHIEPWPGYGGHYRKVALYGNFASHIAEVGTRPNGGIWCWMQFEYEVPKT